MKMRFIKGIEPGPSLSFEFNGEIVQGWEGESIASALLRNGRLAQRITRRYRSHRGYYCGMGICWECAVRIEGGGVVKSCITSVQEGLRVISVDDSVQP